MKATPENVIRAMNAHKATGLIKNWRHNQAAPWSRGGTQRPFYLLVTPAGGGDVIELRNLREADVFTAALASASHAAVQSASPARLYGLTADEWLHLACEGENSEVAPCCGDIGELREWLQALTASQDAGLLAKPVLDAYEVALVGHDMLASPDTFPLLHRVLAGIRGEITVA